MLLDHIRPNFLNGRSKNSNHWRLSILQTRTNHEYRSTGYEIDFEYDAVLRSGMKKRTAVSDQEKFYEVIVISPSSSRRSSHREPITGMQNNQRYKDTKQNSERDQFKSRRRRTRSDRRRWIVCTEIEINRTAVELFLIGFSNEEDSEYIFLALFERRGNRSPPLDRDLCWSSVIFRFGLIVMIPNYQIR